MTKYIFVTGGVVSGLGKGITAASIGRRLKARGLKVAAQKLDPYINVDPGTMSPYQHGEVYVTEDGAGIRYWGGKNAPYIWMACPDGMKSWDFFDLLLNEIQVVGTPGEGFGACSEGFFRLSSFGDPEDTRIAAERIRQMVAGEL